MIYPADTYTEWMQMQTAKNVEHCVQQADVVNKTAFGLMVWYAATIDTKAMDDKA